MVVRIREDARARGILFDTYWSSAGWRQPPATDPSDLAYARAVGYMFEPATGTHDEWVARARAAGASVTLQAAASAFVGSLGSRQLAARSALGSAVTVSHLEPHAFRRWPGATICGACGLPDSSRPVDLSVQSFERHKWGGVRHGDLVYAWLDLDVFARSEQRAPTADDRAILGRVLDVARQAPPDARPADLERAIAPHLASSTAERRVLLEILALAGILATPSHPGLLAEWVPVAERQLPPTPSRNDWSYPMCWWRGSNGVDEAAVSAVFGDLAG